MEEDTKSSDDGDMLPDYDFTGAERGEYAAGYAEGTNLLALAPDVAEAFRDSRSVNRALRSLIDLVQLVEEGSAGEAVPEPPLRRAALKASPEEVAKARFSPGLIKKLRKRLGVTQAELATILDVSPTTVAFWEQGRNRPAHESKEALAALRKLGRRDIQRILEAKGARR